MKQISNKQLGIFSILLANVCWGLMAPVSKDLLNQNVITPWALSGVRILGGAILFWLVGLIAPARVLDNRCIEKSDWLKIICASLLVIGANQALVIMGMSYTSPLDATIVCSVTPIFTLLLGLIFMHDRLNWRKTLGVLLGFVGMLAFIFNSTPNEAINVSNPMLGNILCLLAQLCGALYLVFFGSLFAKYSAFTLMKWMFTVSALVLLPFMGTDVCRVQWTSMPLGALFDVAYIWLIATGLCYFLLPIAQRYVKPTTIAIFNYLQPIVGVLVSALVGLAILDALTVCFSLLILVGVWLVSKE